jgi:hypothetical protein
MAPASFPSFAASPESRQLWQALSAAQQKTVRNLRDALALGSSAGLSKWHQLGRLAMALSASHQEAYGQKTLESLGELVGRSSQLIAKARKFAQLYEPSAVVTLPNNLRWEHLLRLLAIADESIRRELIDDCSSNNWPLRRLQQEISNRAGRQRGSGQGGRPSHRPQTDREFLNDLDRLLTPILHWYQALDTAVPSAAASHSKGRQTRSPSVQSFGIENLRPPRLRRRLIEGMRDLAELRQLVQELMSSGSTKRRVDE